LGKIHWIGKTEGYRDEYDQSTLCLYLRDIMESTEIILKRKKRGVCDATHLQSQKPEYRIRSPAWGKVVRPCLKNNKDKNMTEACLER
jgi:hypothetical protein